MRVVLDTNIIVSGLLSKDGNCGEIVNLALAGEIELCIDDRILSEYERVLRRPKFPFSSDQIEALISYIRHTAHTAVSAKQRFTLPDPDDIKFLELASACDAEFLVTGNARHFPPEHCGQVNVIGLADFLGWFRNQT